MNGTSLTFNLNPHSDEWGVATLKCTGTSKGQTYTYTERFPWNKKTGAISNQDHPFLIRIKGMFLIAYNMAAMAIRVIYYVAITIFQLLLIQPFSLAIDRIAYSLGRRKELKPLAKAKEEITKPAYNIWRSIYYGIRMEGRSIQMVFMPMTGKAGYDLLERTLNQQSEGPFYRRENKEPWKVYCAPCMQSLGFATPESSNVQKMRVARLLAIYARIPAFAQP